MSDVEVLLTVGKLDASLALLTTQDHHVIEFPTMLLPDNVKAGSIVKLSVSQNLEEEKRQLRLFRDIQMRILEKYGIEKPKAPILKIVNVTQTSCVLAWDPLSLGSARLKSLILYRQGVRSMVIPSPLKTVMTKISGLSIDTDYEFQLKLSTTSGQYWSEKVKMHTHKMTDMSGITVCLGSLDPSQNISGEQIAESLQKVGARKMQKHTAIDTTHFVTNDADNDSDPELVRAKSSNIPIVRPEWVRACEVEKRIVGVRGFYLDADPGILKSYQFPKVSGSKVKFANELETIGDEKREAVKKLEGEEGNEQNDKDLRKDGEEVNPDPTNIQGDVDLDKLKDVNEATTETTMELDNDVIQSAQDIDASKNDQGSVLAQEAIDRGVENETMEIHKKSGGLQTSVEPTDSKGQEEEHIKPNGHSSEDNGTVESEEASTHPNMGKRIDTNEETLRFTSEDIKDKLSELKTANTKNSSIPSTPVPEERPDVKDETFANGSIETKDKMEKEDGEVAVSDSEKRLNTEEETLRVGTEPSKDKINESEQEKVEEPSVPSSTPVPEELPDVKDETFANGSIETKDKVENEDGGVAVSDSEKRLNTEEETLGVGTEPSKDKMNKSEQEKVEEPSVPSSTPVPEELPDVKDETFANGSIETKDKVEKEDGGVAVSDSEKRLNTEEETLRVGTEPSKDKMNKSEQEKVEEPSVPSSTPVPEELPDVKDETFANGSSETKDKMEKEDGEVAVSDSEKRLNTEEETLRVGTEPSKDKMNKSEQEKVEEPSVPSSTPVPEELPDVKDETFANGSIETKDKVEKEDGGVAVSDSEKRLNTEEETLRVGTEPSKDKMNKSEQEKVEEPSVPSSTPVPEERPDIKDETSANGSIETKDKIHKEDGKTIALASEKQLDYGKEDRLGDSNTDVIIASTEKVNTENLKCENASDFAGAKPEEDRDLDGPNVSHPETKPSEVQETHLSDVVGKGQTVESYIGEPAETNSLQVSDASHNSDSNAEGKVTTSEYSSSQPKNVRNGKKNKKKNKNKK